MEKVIKEFLRMLEWVLEAKYQTEKFKKQEENSNEIIKNRK